MTFFLLNLIYVQIGSCYEAPLWTLCVAKAHLTYQRLLRVSLGFPLPFRPIFLLFN